MVTSIEGQLEPLPFEAVFTQRLLRLLNQSVPTNLSNLKNFHLSNFALLIKLLKVGVGAYSEVFGFTDGEVVVKLKPFGGDVPYHDRPQSKISEMCIEVAATKAISDLQSNHDSGSRTDNFVRLISVTVLKGPLPSYLVEAKRKSNDPVPVPFVEESEFSHLYDFELHVIHRDKRISELAFIYF